MNALTPLLATAHVALDVSAGSKKRVLEQIAEAFVPEGFSANRLFQALLERERLGSTGLGEGIAIPHARIPGLTQPRLAFLRLAQPVPFDALDGKPVQLVVALLVPEQATDLHLQILSELAERLSHPEVRAALQAAPDAAAALAALRV
jgi:PTS system nitrogen regulatory IIA component